MYLTHEQRDALKVAASAVPRYDRIDEIDTLVAQLQRVNPCAFHTDASLHERVFVHRPRGDVPFKAFYRASAKVSSTSSE